MKYGIYDTKILFCDFRNDSEIGWDVDREVYFQTFFKCHDIFFYTAVTLKYKYFTH